MSISLLPQDRLLSLSPRETLLPYTAPYQVPFLHPPPDFAPQPRAARPQPPDPRQPCSFSLSWLPAGLKEKLLEEPPVTTTNLCALCLPCLLTVQAYGFISLRNSLHSEVAARLRGLLGQVAALIPPKHSSSAAGHVLMALPDQKQSRGARLTSKAMSTVGFAQHPWGLIIIHTPACFP